MTIANTNPIYVVVKGTTWDISRNVAQLKGHMGKIVANDMNGDHMEATGLFPSVLATFFENSGTTEHKDFQLYRGENDYVKALHLD